MRALALISGGLDSVVAAWAARDEYAVAAAMTFDYGQRAAAPEIAAAAAVAAKIGCEHIVLGLPWLGALGRNALTDAARAVPELAESELDDAERTRESAQAVWVPNRNGVFVNVAAAHAEALDCDAIVCGFNVEEAATFADNSAAFMDAADRFFELSTLRRPRLISPTVGLNKREIVLLGRQLGAPLGDVWSCYHGGPEHCWACESCGRLRRALDSAGAWEEWARERASLS